MSRQEVDEKNADFATYAAAVREAQANLGRLLAMKAYATVRAPFAGEVTMRSADIGDLVGPGATKHKLGDKVMSLVAGGGYAPYCIAQDAQAMAVRLQREFGLLVGTSSGANVAAALAQAADLGPSARVVTLLCDRAERYFSTRLFAGAASPGSADQAAIAAPAANVTN